MVPVHVPVLLAETLEWLKPRSDGELMVDSTLGEGGHTEAFLLQFPALRVIGLDADSAIQERARDRLAAFGDRISFKNVYFDHFFADSAREGQSFDTILFDLGISIFHYELSGRGFSFRKDEPLDMRINPFEGESAADIVNSYREDDLANLIFEFGEERYSRRIARGIVEARRLSPIRNSAALADIIFRASPADYRHLALHPATRTFQALRIAANRELERLESALANAVSCLRADGRIGVITFHSLEDRIVKRFFQELAKTCSCPPEQPRCTCGGKPTLEILTRKPVGPTDAESKSNPPSRSAKLRVARKAA